MKIKHDPFGPKLSVQARYGHSEWTHKRYFETDCRSEAEAWIARHSRPGWEFRIVTTERQEPCYAF